MYATTAKLVERARRGEGPAFVWANTYRYAGHHVGDISREYYRAKQEEQQWKTERDPIQVLTDWFAGQPHASNDASAAVLEKIRTEAQAEIEKAVQFAMAAPYPDASKVTEDVYA